MAARTSSNTVTVPKGDVNNPTVSTNTKTIQEDVVLSNENGGCYLVKVLLQGS